MGLEVGFESVGDSSSQVDSSLGNGLEGGVSGLVGVGLNELVNGLQTEWVVVLDSGGDDVLGLDVVEVLGWGPAGSLLKHALQILVLFLSKGVVKGHCWPGSESLDRHPSNLGFGPAVLDIV